MAGVSAPWTFSDAIPRLALVKDAADIGISQRRLVFVVDEVLLGDISDVFSLVVFGEEMVEGLVAFRPNFRRDGIPPFSVLEYSGSTSITHTAERKHLVANDLAKRKFCVSLFHGMYFLSQY